MKDSKRKEKRSLPVPLTGKEFEERALELAGCDETLAEIDVKKKAAVDEFKRQSGTVVSRKNELRVIIQERKEDREVDCEWRENFKQKCWDLFRLDTNKKADTKAMTAEDLQGRIPGTDGDGGKKDDDGKKKRQSKKKAADKK